MIDAAALERAIRSKMLASTQARLQNDIISIAADLKAQGADDEYVKESVAYIIAENQKAVLECARDTARRMIAEGFFDDF
jgi:hypothetical protein